MTGPRIHLGNWILELKADSAFQPVRVIPENHPRGEAWPVKAELGTPPLSAAMVTSLFSATVAPMSETAPVPEEKGLATFLCQPLSAAMVTLLLSATVAPMSETAPVPEAMCPATFLCTSCPRQW